MTSGNVCSSRRKDSNTISRSRMMLWLFLFVFVSLWSGSHGASSPTGQPSSQPSSQPIKQTSKPTAMPVPTKLPTSRPSNQPSSQPSRQPSRQPTSHPSAPTGQPTSRPTSKPTYRAITLSHNYTSVVLQVTQVITAGVTLDQATSPAFQTAFVTAVAMASGVAPSTITINQATAATPTGVTMVYTIYATNSLPDKLTAAVLANAPIVQSLLAASLVYPGVTVGPPTLLNITPTRAPTNVPPPQSKSASTVYKYDCFTGTEHVSLENGHTKTLAQVQVGDRILTLTPRGDLVFSDVVYVPHGKNQQRATFVKITTESGRDLQMTRNHMLPVGACALSILPLIAAGKVLVGDCVQTVSGREQVVSIGNVKGQGVYTVIAMEELIVVNGIVATPFGGVNPTLANWYYNLHRLVYFFVRSSREKFAINPTDTKSWSSSWSLLTNLPDYLWFLVTYPYHPASRSR